MIWMTSIILTRALANERRGGRGRTREMAAWKTNFDNGGKSMGQREWESSRSGKRQENGFSRTPRTVQQATLILTH